MIIDEKDVIEPAIKIIDKHICNANELEKLTYNVINAMEMQGKIYCFNKKNLFEIEEIVSELRILNEKYRKAIDSLIKEKNNLGKSFEKYTPPQLPD